MQSKNAKMQCKVKMQYPAKRFNDQKTKLIYKLIEHCILIHSSIVKGHFIIFSGNIGKSEVVDKQPEGQWLTINL